MVEQTLLISFVLPCALYFQGSTCQNGLCCRTTGVQTCPNGAIPTQTCVGTGQSNCPVGYYCYNGGCCLQQGQRCPSGQPAVSTCTGFGTSNCPIGGIMIIA